VISTRPPAQRSRSTGLDNCSAQLRYSANVHHWSLYWADRNGRWHRYDNLSPSAIDEVLNEIGADPTCIFWG
jgi:hypothetical protein